MQIKSIFNSISLFRKAQNKETAAAYICEGMTKEKLIFMGVNNDDTTVEIEKTKNRATVWPNHVVPDHVIKSILSQS